jgi:hypothetical protein
MRYAILIATLYLILGALAFMVGVSNAASLVWDPTADGFLLLQYSQTESGPFTVIKEIPASPPSFPITEFGYYKITVPNGGPSSNVAHYSLDVESGDDARLDSLESRVSLLEKPVSVSNIMSKQLDANRIEIIGQACTSLKTTGTGLKRIVECVH